MKITKRQLRRIIKEEVKALKENEREVARALYGAVQDALDYLPTEVTLEVLQAAIGEVKKKAAKSSGGDIGYDPFTNP
jgi:hypothetical protein